MPYLNSCHPSGEEERWHAHARDKKKYCASKSKQKKIYSVGRFLAIRFSSEQPTRPNKLSKSAWFLISSSNSVQYFRLFLELRTTVLATAGVLLGAGPGSGSRKGSPLRSTDGVFMDWQRTLPCLSQGPYLPVWLALLRVLFIGWAKSRTLRVSSDMLEAALLFTSNFWRCEAR